MHKSILMLGTAVVLAVAPACPGWASISCFQLEPRVWYATEIVLAEQQGNDVKVLETWRGALTPGTVIPRLDLPKMPLAVSKPWPKAEEPLVGSVTGRRVVLFLKRLPQRSDRQPGREWVGADSWWVPAEAAAVWLEEGLAYAMQHGWSDEPLKMEPLSVEPNKHASEEDFKRAMHKLLAEKDALADARQLADPAKRVLLLEPMTRAHFWGQRHEAIEALGQCSQAAVPTLTNLIRHDDYFSCDAAQALAQAYGDEAPAQMTELITGELAFWKEEAAKLPTGLQDRLHAVHQYRRGVLLAALRTIEKAHYLPARDTVQALRDFWASLPHPKDVAEPDWLVTECDRVLKVLDADPVAPAGK